MESNKGYQQVPTSVQLTETSTPYPLSREEEALVRRKCKRCGQYYSLSTGAGPCFYHPGEWREPTPHSGALVGWSCCAVAGFVDQLHLLSVLNQNALKKDSKGCQEEPQHEEDLEYSRASAAFPFHAEDIASGGILASKNAVDESETPFSPTAAPLSPSDTRINKNFISHKLLRTDTLPGLALRHGTTVEAIKRANNLFSDSLGHMETILIPLKPGVTPPPKQVDPKVEATQRFLKATRCTREEAKYYLESAEYNVDQALADFQSDLRWERDQPTKK